MPVHDWTRVSAGLFHDFHQAWTISIRNALNGGGLPPGFFALVDQRFGGFVPDVLTLKRNPKVKKTPDPGGGLAVADAPPTARFVATESAHQTYARRANRIAVRNADDELVAVIEIVSPGNKSGTEAVRSFVAKAREFLDSGVNLLIVDLFPPTPRDPQGLHGEPWDFDPEEPFALPPDKPLTVAAYVAATRMSYVEPVAVGDVLPSLPIFLDDPTRYVPAPLEATYVRTWNECPEPVREAVTGEA